MSPPGPVDVQQKVWEARANSLGCLPETLHVLIIQCWKTQARGLGKSRRGWAGLRSFLELLIPAPVPIFKTEPGVFKPQVIPSIS